MTTAEKLYDEAFACSQKQELEKAFTLYRGAAELGYAPAQVNLGFAYLHGKGVKNDDAQAVYWFQKAADQNHAAAISNLGFCYSFGRGVPKDKYRALALYKKAADMGNESAARNYANLYRELEGTMASGDPAPSASPAPDIKSLDDFVKFAEGAGIHFSKGSTAPNNYHSKKDLEAADRIIQSYVPTGINRFFNKLLGVFIAGLIYLAADSGFDESFLAGAAVFGLFIAIILALKAIIPFNHRIKYYKQNHLDDLIRKDHGSMPICVKVYNAFPGKKILAYIRKLNPEAAQKIGQMSEKK